MTDRQIEQYLERINFTRTPKVDQDTLRGLQFHHLMSVPFENLDIYRKVRIELEIDRLFDKIVRGRRGGFCYELNGLFSELLKAIGFEIKMIAGRVYNKLGVRGPDFDHLALMVRIDGQDFLADVGFGEFAFSPLRFNVKEACVDERGIFIFETFGTSEFRVSKKKEEEVVPQYTFSIDDHQLKDFEAMCHYHQTSEDSHFTKKGFITRPTPDGRIILFEDKIVFRERDEVVREEEIDENKFYDMLEKFFGIKL
jgi:N-hydroxyarylamine O-acetyltransferase